MRVLTLIFLLVISGCAKNMHTHEINHCGGIDIPICYEEVEGKRSLDEEIEFQEKDFKSKMLQSLTLILDQVVQKILTEGLQ